MGGCGGEEGEEGRGGVGGKVKEGAGRRRVRRRVQGGGVAGCRWSRARTHLPTSGFYHKFSGQVSGGLRLQWPDHYTLIQRISGDNL